MTTHHKDVYEATIQHNVRHKAVRYDVASKSYCTTPHHTTMKAEYNQRNHIITMKASLSLISLSLALSLNLSLSVSLALSYLWLYMAPLDGISIPYLQKHMARWEFLSKRQSCVHMAHFQLGSFLIGLKSNDVPS